MARINLLPWREHLRQEQQRQFISILGLTAVAGVGLLIGAIMFTNDMLENQASRNQVLQTDISKVDAKIKEIKELDKTKQALIDRMEIIQRLQQSRPEIVHIFDEIVTTLPNGLFLTELVQKQNSLSIKGMAESDARVSNYMHNLEASPWLASPKLTVIQSKSTNTDRKKGRGTRKKESSISIRSFALEVEKETPKLRKGG